jgi:hypothetical protein
VKRLLLLVCLAGLLPAVEPPPVPDPIGLGERLALIDHLHEAYGIRVAPGATLEDLRARYAAAWSARQAPVDDGAAERCRRLRERIATRHGVEAETPADEAGLRAQLARLDAERAERDRAAIAALVAADAAAPRIDPPVETASDAPPAAPAAAAPAAPAAAATPAEAPAAQVRRIAFRAASVADCWLASAGERTALLVTLGADHNGAFTGIREAAWHYLSQAPAIRRSVLLLGHGTGNSIAGESIEGHLRANKAFYETMGGTAPAQPIECLIFASCSASNPDQMRAMRDGLGYFPTWRVATSPRAFATGFSVIAALRDVAARPARPAWRGLYRMGLSGDEVGAFGEVGVDGERAETTYWRLIQEAGQWKVVEQR